MNYLTPERLVRLQDRSNKEEFLAALTDWEHALRAYKKRLVQVYGALPAELQQQLYTSSLHDARVLDMWWGGRSQFTITLRPESDPSRLVVLTYSLLSPPAVQEGTLPQSVRSEPVAWLYDELDVANKGRNGTAFLHRILLSDGREITLRFRHVMLRRPVPLVPVAPGNDQDAVRSSA